MTTLYVAVLIGFAGFAGFEGHLDRCQLDGVYFCHNQQHVDANIGTV